MILFQDVPAPVPPELPTPVIVSGPSAPDPNLIIPQIVEMVGLAIVAIAVTVAAVKIFRPLIEAWAARLTGRGSRQLQADVDQLRDQVAEVDMLRTRVAELEERVDFTERLLTRQEAPRELPR